MALYCLLTSVAFGQNKAEQALLNFQKKYPVEKIYLQYNKQEYVAGEQLWFKSYVFSGYLLSEISTNLYVELYDHEKKLLEKSIVPLVGGIGEGYFALRKEWQEGVYYIRAYTKWTLNFDDQFPYLHQLLIYNPSSPKKLEPKPLHWTAGIFPESGSLLTNVSNKVAVRLFTKGSLPLKWSARLFEISDPNSTLLSFTSYNKEIGSFYFKPAEGKSYGLEITDDAKNKQTFKLPVAINKGVIMKARQDDTLIVCDLVFKNFKKSNYKYKLIGQMYNQIVYKAIVARQDSIVQVTLPVNKLANGILHFTLFNEKEEPVAERLIFVDAASAGNVSLLFDTIATEPRGLNHWTTLMDTIGFASYTYIVEDAHATPADENLLSSLWLTNDIVNKVNVPAWYFRKIDSNKKNALDALLITEKWKWFQWKNILVNHFPTITHQPDYYLSYTGTVFHRKTMQLNKQINLIFQAKDSTLSFQQVNTDSTGSFTINGAAFIDTVKAYYQLDHKKRNAPSVKIYFEQNNSFQRLKSALPISNYVLIDRPTNETLPIALQKAMNTLANQQKVDNRFKQLQEVVVKSSKRKSINALNDRLSSPGFNSIDQVIFDLTNPNQALPYSDVGDFVRSKLPLINISGRYRGIVISYYVDEMRMDFSYVKQLSLADVAMIKFLRNPTGAVSGDAAMLIYTKKGDGGNVYFNAMPSGTLVGYSLIPTVSMVDYKSDLYSVINKDERPQLYWNTWMEPDRFGKGHIRFYNNDVTKQFKLTIMGITQGGLPVYTEQIINATGLKLD